MAGSSWRQLTPLKNLVQIGEGISQSPRDKALNQEMRRHYPGPDINPYCHLRPRLSRSEGSPNVVGIKVLTRDHLGPKAVGGSATLSRVSHVSAEPTAHDL